MIVLISGVLLICACVYLYRVLQEESERQEQLDKIREAEKERMHKIIDEAINDLRGDE